MKGVSNQLCSKQLAVGWVRNLFKWMQFNWSFLAWNWLKETFVIFSNVREWNYCEIKLLFGSKHPQLLPDWQLSYKFKLFWFDFFQWFISQKWLEMFIWKLWEYLLTDQWSWGRVKTCKMMANDYFTPHAQLKLLICNCNCKCKCGNKDDSKKAKICMFYPFIA